MQKIDLQKIDLNLLVLFEMLMQQGSVSKAADKIGRTQSAVSHALGRLREQLGDPLLVKVSGRMQPSPYALELVQEVRPILRSIERVLSVRNAFDASTSTRRFRLVMPDLAMNLFPLLMQRIQRDAPHVLIEWETPKETTLLEVAEGMIDLALLPDAIKRPEGVAAEVVGQFQWASFVREGHPAAQNWGKKSWSTWPHIAVSTGNRLSSPLSLAAEVAKLKRKVGVVVPTFGAVAPLLAQTDMIASLPVIVLADAVQRFGLQVRPIPFHLPHMPHALAWSARLNSEPASLWFRNCFTTVFKEHMKSLSKLL